MSLHTTTTLEDQTIDVRMLFPAVQLSPSPNIMLGRGVGKQFITVRCDTFATSSSPTKRLKKGCDKGAL